MHKIVYDLETSGLNFCNQILTFSFKEIDENYNVIDKCEGSIKLKRFELPEPLAILANRIDVQQHQENAEYTEYQAMNLIHSWLKSKTEHNQTYLMGKNSYKFDLPFLRTSMIRNGLNPYLGTNVNNRDLQHNLNEVFIAHIPFRELIKTYIKNNPTEGLLSLETVAKAIGILTTKQTHNASDDVDLTIQVIKYIENEIPFKGIFQHHPYSLMQKHEKSQEIIATIRYNKENIEIPIIEFLYPYKFKDSNALWINLTRIETLNSLEVKDFREYFNWINRKDGYRFVCKIQDVQKFTGVCGLVELQKQFSIDSGTLPNVSIDKVKKVGESFGTYAHEELNLSTENFFGERNCDIEQHIYRIPFNDINLLDKVIKHKTALMINEATSYETKEIYRRFFINYYPSEKLKDSTKSQEIIKFMKEYTHYRYGEGAPTMDSEGNKFFKSLKIDKFDTTFSSRKEKSEQMSEEDFNKTFHPTLLEMIHSLGELHNIATVRGDKETMYLLEKLYNFYINSTPYKILQKGKLNDEKQ